MSHKPPDDKDGLLGRLKRLWLPIAGFLGAVTLSYNFYQLWLGDQTTVTYFLTGGGLVVLIIALIWAGFGYRTNTRDAVWPIGAKRTEKIPVYPSLYQKISRIVLSVVIIGLAFGGWMLIQHRRALEEKLVVVIANFEGPEDVYGLRNEIIENLNKEFSGDKDIEIKVIDEVVTLTLGNEYARSLGEHYLADLVIWGWYRPTDNPNITIHIENLHPQQYFRQPPEIDETYTFEPVTTLSELESFAFQQQLGSQTSMLLFYLEGSIKFKLREFSSALAYFDKAISAATTTNSFYSINLAEIYLYRAFSEASLQEFNQAISDCTKAIELNPNNVQYYFCRGGFYLFQEDYDLALIDFTNAIEVEPRELDSYRVRGITYIHLMDYDLAIMDLTKFIDSSQEISNAHYYRAIAYFALKKFDQAINDLNKDLEASPEKIESYVLRGRSYSAISKYDLAIDDYTHAIDFTPGLLQNYLDTKKFDENLANVITVSNVESIADAYYHRGSIYAILKRYDLAIEDYSSAIEIKKLYETKSELASIYFVRGSVYQAIGQHDSADQDYYMASKLDPYNVNFYFARAGIFAHSENYDEVIEELSKVLLIEPNNGSIFFARGLAYREAGVYERAIQDFTSAINLDINDAAVYYYRGTSFAMLDRYEDGILDFDQVISRDPNNAIGYYTRGATYFILGDRESAFRDFDMAIDIDPKSASAYSSRGLGYFDTGQYEQAVKDFSKAIELNPNDASTYHMRARAYQQLNELAKAEADFKKYEELTGQKP